MISTFQRIEKKYLINQKTYDTLLQKLKEQITPDSYFKSTICNVYFDTNHNDLIVRSLDKPVYKEKLRLRSYGIPNMDSIVFLEIKKKYKSIVNKRRIQLKLKDFYKYKNNNPKTQIEKEIDYFFKIYDVKPALYLAYDRLAYIGVNDSSLRITFDNNIRSRRFDLNLEKGDFGNKLLSDDTYLMEIKINNTYPLWLVRILSDLKIYPTSFSKYGKIYEKERNEVNV
ncbi:MAG: polyphosphate polymerase domain-containing protein [Bacilli bacterium]|nr:polyphosphate polymerase domain-containing protein [Bacilli bacterium]